MADRNTAGLTTRALALTDVFATQIADGSAEAGKASMQDLRTLLQRSKTAILSITYSAGTFAIVVLENSFDPSITFTVSTPSSGIINIVPSLPIFTAGKTFAQGSTLISASGAPYFLNGIPSTVSLFLFGIFKYDGSQTSTPPFTNIIFQIKVFP